MDDAGLAQKESSFNVPPYLSVTIAGDREVVHIGCTPIANHFVSDVTSRRQVMVQLAEAGGLKAVQIADCFGVTPVYLSQLRGRYRQQGSVALRSERRGPKGPMKVTPRLETRVRKLREKGLTYKAIAEEVSGQQEISYQTVRRILQKDEVQQNLLKTEVTEEYLAPPSEPVDSAPVVKIPKEGESQYAGAMLLHVALGEMGLWSVFEKVGALVGQTKLGVKQVVGTIALGFALQLRSIEGFKTALRGDFGMLLGLAKVPCVQTLRAQVASLAESVEPDVVMRKLFEAFVELEPVWEGAYYVDGHFCGYSGARPLPKGWNAKRRIVETGQSDVYVHDASGRALFFINRPLNEHLSKVLPKVVEEIRRISKDEKILLIFDRGGYSGALFKKLQSQGIEFITYLKGRKAKRRFPSNRFKTRWYEVSDPAGIKKSKRQVYKIYEKGTRVHGAGVLKTLVVQDEKGQVPVITNISETSPAKIVSLLKMRWRQENSFKYLSDHYGIEQLIQYDADYFKDQRLMDNPKRKILREKLEGLRTEIVAKEAELGRASESKKQPDGELKTLQRRARRDIKKLNEKVTRLENRLAHTPTKVPASELTGKTYRATMRTERRNLVNAIKIATYNAERLLARRFFKHYKDPRDWLTFFRSILQLPGTITNRSTDEIVVELRPPDEPKVRHALALMLAELNALGGRTFGDGQRLTFALKS